ncbi:MAG: hypothetical protein JSU90_05355, partial [Nitrospiraceae bacterium]
MKPVSPVLIAVPSQAYVSTMIHTTYRPALLLLSILISVFIPSLAPALEMSSKRDCVVCHIMWLDDFRTD